MPTMLSALPMIACRSIFPKKRAGINPCSYTSLPRRRALLTLGRPDCIAEVRRTAPRRGLFALLPARLAGARRITA